MNNNELDDILDRAFEPLRKPPPGPSISDDVMQRIKTEALPEVSDESEFAVQGRDHGWVLGFACLLGALVCAPSFAGLELGNWLSGVPFEAFGAYADVAAALGMAALICTLCLPLVFVVLDD